MNYMAIRFSKTQNGSQEVDYKVYSNLNSAYYGFYEYLKQASQSTKAIDGAYLMDENGKLVEAPKTFVHEASE